MKHCSFILVVFLLTITGTSTVCSGQDAQSPVFKVGDSWTYDKRSVKVTAVTDNGYTTEEKIINPVASSTLCGAGTSVLEASIKRDRNTNIIDITDLSGKPIGDCSYQKGNRWLDFPLAVGKKWEFTAKLRTNHGSAAKEAHLDTFSNAMTVESMEEVVVPAGKFKAFKIKHGQRRVSCSISNSASKWFGTAYYWYAPDIKRTIKATDFNNSPSYELKSSDLK